ncbi:hypothetical protein [Nonomuraea sp. NPDC049400]|uniref:hypothetical protein n=1 Tax=Nonomuraea sp. NPDC049400 TaxID=3364352 RepID=UPI003793EA32
MAAAGLEAVGFNMLGVAPPPDTGELARHAGLLESVAGVHRSIGDDGARAYLAAGSNVGAATDALAEHVAGKDGVFPRSTADGLHVSVAASVMKVTFAGHEWAKNLLIGLAGIAGGVAAVAAIRPELVVAIRARLRLFAQRVQQWIRIIRQTIGRHISRLAELLRRHPSKKQIGNNLAAKQQLMAARGRSTLAARDTTRVAHAAQARTSLHRATEGLDQAGRGVSKAEMSVSKARSRVNADINAAVRRGDIDADTSVSIKADRKGLIHHDSLDYDTRQELSQHAAKLKQVEAQLGGHARELYSAGRHVDEGLDIARKYGLDASELQSLQQRVHELSVRRGDLAHRASTTRMDIERPDDLYNVHPF